MHIDREKAKKVFQEYVDNYNSNDGKIKLKIDHTYRVSNICDEIAKELKFSKEDTDIAYIIGLLHDIGRFEQIKRYGTFVDRKSVNHAKLGVEILFEQGKIREFIEDDSEDELIRQAIEYHNAFELPKDLSKRTEIFAKLIRDADKTDIFRVNVTEPTLDVYGHTEEELCNSLLTKEVIDSFKRHETVLKSLEKTAVDNVASHIAFIFGIYYNETIKIILEQGYLNELMKFRSKIDTTNNELDELCEVVNEYVQERIK